MTERDELVGDAVYEQDRALGVAADDVDRPDRIAVDTESDAGHEEDPGSEPCRHTCGPFEVLLDELARARVGRVRDHGAHAGMNEKLLQRGARPHGDADERDALLREAAGKEELDRRSHIAALQVPEREPIAFAVAVATHVEQDHAVTR